MSNHTTIRNLIASIMAAILSVTLLDAVFHLSNMINPGVSYIYNAVGTKIAPNLITAVIFDFRAYDTLGESIVLFTAVCGTTTVLRKNNKEENKYGK